MIPYEVYKTLHLLGLIMVFLSLGGVTLHAMNGGTRETNRGRGWSAAWHGLGLLFLLVGGFGMLARLGLSVAGWVWGKLVIWVLLGGAISLAARRPTLGRTVWIGSAVLGLAATYLALYKPF